MAPRGVLHQAWKAESVLVLGRRVYRQAGQLYRAVSDSWWLQGRKDQLGPAHGLPLPCVFPSCAHHQPRAAAQPPPGLLLQALPCPVWLVRQIPMKYTFKEHLSPTAAYVQPTRLLPTLSLYRLPVPSVSPSTGQLRASAHSAVYLHFFLFTHHSQLNSGG